MKRLITTCSAIVLLLAACVPAHAVPSPANALTNLLVPGATITSGDKVFSNFTWTSSAAGSGVAVSPNDVAVVPYSQVVLGELEYGLQFFTPTMQLTTSPGSISATMTYNVTPNIPGRLISDNTLTMVADGQGGLANITETPTDAATNDALLPAPKLTLWNPVFSIPTVHADYLDAVVSVNVKTDIAVQTASGPVGIRSYTETFSQIPEPATLVLTGLGLLGLVGIARRRK